ncbi:MAG: serine hydrolase domain-containing protein, partial [Bacteroidota bacterium]
ASPESVGLSASRLAQIDTLLNEYMEEEALPGGIVMVGRKGKIAYQKSFGYRNVKKEEPFAMNDIFRLASMTKALTSTAVLKLYEQGEFLLDDPIADYIPAFAETKVMDTFDPDAVTYTTVDLERPITIRHLLTHTTGIAYGFSSEKMAAIYKESGVDKFGLSHKTATTEEMVNLIAAQPLLHQPGTQWTYGYNCEVLGYLVEVVSGQTLGEYLDEHVFTPLGMDDTYFYLPKDKQDRLVPVYGDVRENGLTKYPDILSNYPTYGRTDHFAGGGGLSSTIMDYATFCQMMLNKGEYNGKRILSRKTIELMTTDQLALMDIEAGSKVDAKGTSFCLGYALTTPESQANHQGSVGTFYWGGIYNTKFWIDPEEEMFMVTMVQIIPFQRNEMWQKLNNIIYSAVVD